MIYIRVEMWPGGFKERARLLGEATISNQGGNPDRADYRIEIKKSPEYAKAENVGKPWRRGEVIDFPRARLGPWDLLLRGLLACVGHRNREVLRG
jgi:hypothetical protein